jgi:4-aminobutyrate--pyruvate transaminase
MEEEGLVENAAAMGQRLQDGLRTLLSEDGVGEVRGIGLIAGVELVDDKEKHKPFPVELGVGPRVVALAKEKGLISRNFGDSFLLAPPLVVTEEQIDRSISILREAIQETVAWARRQQAEQKQI